MRIIITFLSLLLLLHPFPLLALTPDEQVKELQGSAEQGDINAQRELGYRYSSGIGVPQNYTEAAKWYRQAADRGDPGAQVWLGLAYAYGQGVPQDDAKSVEWYYKSAKH